MKYLYKVTFSKCIKIEKIEVIAPEFVYRDSLSWAGNFYRETFEKAHKELLRRLLDRKTWLQNALAHNEERYQYALTLKDSSDDRG